MIETKRMIEIETKSEGERHLSDERKLTTEVLIINDYLESLFSQTFSIMLVQIILHCNTLALVFTGKRGAKGEEKKNRKKRRKRRRRRRRRRRRKRRGRKGGRGGGGEEKEEPGGRTGGEGGGDGEEEIGEG